MRVTTTVGLVVAMALTAAIATAASTRVHDGLYAPKANPKLPYSNGAVDLTVYGGGSKLRAALTGEACYTGSAPPAGVPADDELTIHLPRALTITSSRSFSFSGPVTLSAQDAQSPTPLKTTFTLKGSFVKAKDGTYTAKGTASSPLCQASTPTHFTSAYSGVT